MNKDDILIVKPPYHLSSKFAKDMHDQFAKQKESGVVILPCNWSVEVAPSDVKIINSADITECARAIKEYCESQPTCQKCQFKEENGTEHMCALYGCPDEWEEETE